MMDKYPVDTFMHNLAEKDLLDMYKLDSETLSDLAACYIRSTPTKYLPKLEDYDIRRELLTMVGGWIEKRDEDIKDQIMEHLEDLVLKAFGPQMENVFESYRIREENAKAKGNRELEIDNAIFERNRG